MAKLTSYFKRPEHILKCAYPECENLGLREDACPVCEEYRCYLHIKMSVLNQEVLEEYSSIIDPITKIETCSFCYSKEYILTKSDMGADEVKDLSVKFNEITTLIGKNNLRSQYYLLLYNKFVENLKKIDSLDQSPLEQKLWAYLLFRNLDKYYDPQIELFDNKGEKIRRVDFASTLLKIAIFTDGETYHSSPEARQKDNRDNKRLEDMKWVVLRYRTNEINNEIERVFNDIYQTTCTRILSIQDSLA